MIPVGSAVLLWQDGDAKPLLARVSGNLIAAGGGAPILMARLAYGGSAVLCLESRAMDLTCLMHRGPVAVCIAEPGRC